MSVMTLMSLECKSCGAGLPIDESATLVECEFCHTAHRVDRSSGGTPQLTMLEAAVKEIGGDMKVVKQRTRQLLELQELVAKKDEARHQLDRLRREHEELVNENRASNLRLKTDYESRKAALAERVEATAPRNWGAIGLGLLLLLGAVAGFNIVLPLGFVLLLASVISICVGASGFHDISKRREAIERNYREQLAKHKKAVLADRVRLNRLAEGHQKTLDTKLTVQ